MKISTKGRYAMRVMVDLAIHNNGRFIPLKELSERQEVTLKYLEQIIPLLNKAGYLNSSRGSNGGYRLAREPRDYTAGDILRASEGELTPVATVEALARAADARSGRAETPDFWRGLDAAINTYVDGVTLEDLAQQALGLDGFDYSI